MAWDQRDWYTMNNVVQQVAIANEITLLRIELDHPDVSQDELKRLKDQVRRFR